MKKGFVYIVLVMLLGACAQTKPLITKHRELKQIESVALYDSVTNYYGNVTSFSTKFTAQVINPKAIQVKGTIKIKKDSIIWVTISPALNIEAFRCIFTKDSVQFVNRMDKTFYQGDYSIISSMTGVAMDYNSIQSILLNEFVFYPFNQSFDTVTSIKNYDVSKRKNEFLLENYSDKNRRALTGRKSDSLLVLQKFAVDINSFRISEILFEDQFKNLKVQTKYSTYFDYAGISFPKIVNFEVKENKKKMQMILLYDRTEFNIEQSYPFSINSKFKPYTKEIK